MNDVIINRIEIIKNNDVRENKFELKDTAIREEYIINGSFCMGYSAHAQNRNTPALVIETRNIWRNSESAKGKDLNQACWKPMPISDHWFPLQSGTRKRYGEGSIIQKLLYYSTHKSMASFS